MYVRPLETQGTSHHSFSSADAGTLTADSVYNTVMDRVSTTLPKVAMPVLHLPGQLSLLQS